MTWRVNTVVCSGVTQFTSNLGPFTYSPTPFKSLNVESFKYTNIFLKDSYIVCVGISLILIGFGSVLKYSSILKSSPI